MPATQNLDKKTVKVILDSNALFVPLQFKIDIFEELGNLLKANFEPVLLSSVQLELEKLSQKKNTKMGKIAQFALKQAEKCKRVKVETEEGLSTDDIIVKIASQWHCPVFTNDTDLKKRLRDINVPIIYVRQKSRLEIEGRL
ncbi:MAG: hypothetical protein QW840_04490 [Candidatus Bathyarchaeia archaeon]